MHWLHSRLNRRFSMGTAAGLLASSLVFLMLYLGLYRTELASERAEAAEQVNQLLQTSLENAMLKRDIDGLRVIVDRLGQQPGIEAVFTEITTLSSTPTRLSISRCWRASFRPAWECSRYSRRSSRYSLTNPSRRATSCRARSS